jgi:hypothetical protein
MKNNTGCNDRYYLRSTLLSHLIKINLAELKLFDAEVESTKHQIPNNI